MDGVSKWAKNADGSVTAYPKVTCTESPEKCAQRKYYAIGRRSPSFFDDGYGIQEALWARRAAPNLFDNDYRTVRAREQVTIPKVVTDSSGRSIFQRDRDSAVLHVPRALLDAHRKRDFLDHLRRRGVEVNAGVRVRSGGLYERDFFDDDKKIGDPGIW